MSEPVITRILQDLAADLAFTFTDTAGKSITTTVTRPTKTIDPDWSPRHGEIVLAAGDAGRNDELSGIGSPPSAAWDQAVVIEGFYHQSDAGSSKIDDELDLFIAAAIAAIMADPQRSALAIDTRIDAIGYLRASEDGYDGFSLSVSVTYRTPENDWTTVA